MVEHHKTGYGHVHIAIFVDGKVDESDFHPAIDAHLRVCDIAHRDAHDYFSTDPDNRPISVRRVDTDLSSDEYDNHEEVGNLGLYIGEYIGSYGKELFDRDTEELIFRASCWATGTQMVRFSTGANEVISDEIEREKTGQIEGSAAEASSHVETSETKELDEMEGRDDWSILGIGRADRSGETMFDMQRNGVKYRKIEGAEHLDPPNIQPPNKPVRRLIDSTLNNYNATSSREDSNI